MDKRSVVTMKIIKRNGAEEDFDNNKIVVAVAKANTAATQRSVKRIRLYLAKIIV